MEQRHSIAFVLAAIVASYGAYLVFDPRTVSTLGREDHVFENLTVVFFFLTSILFALSFRRTRNVFYLLLALAFFVGAGEEMSWGQRLLGFATPEALRAVNVQQEFNLHNLAPVNPTDFSGNYKQGLAKILTVNFLYKVFWLGFGILIPLAVLTSSTAAALATRLRFPVAPLALGVLFVVNWLAYRLTFSLLPPGHAGQYYATAVEIQECLSALVFMALGFHFLRRALETNTDQRPEQAIAPRTGKPGAFRARYS